METAGKTKKKSGQQKTRRRISIGPFRNIQYIENSDILHHIHVCKILVCADVTYIKHYTNNQSHHLKSTQRIVFYKLFSHWECGKTLPVFLTGRKIKMQHTLKAVFLFYGTVYTCVRRKPLISIYRDQCQQFVASLLHGKVQYDPKNLCFRTKHVQRWLLQEFNLRKLN